MSDDKPSRYDDPRVRTAIMRTVAAMFPRAANAYLTILNKATGTWPAGAPFQAG